MNQAHLQALRSPERRRWLQAELLPWLEAAGVLGDDVLEVGPGPGLTTDLLKERSAKVTAVEKDPHLADELAKCMAGTNVEVIAGDATQNELPSDRFSSVCCFSSLHHVPTPELQDRLFAQALRVLAPGGSLFGEDPADSPFARFGHTGDTFVPLEPAALRHRLETTGFKDIVVEVTGRRIRFVARKPGDEPARYSRQ
jgi:SAM-dependent methyltransferase